MNRPIPPRRVPHEKTKQKTTPEEKLDDALDDSFPASDPPSMTDPQKHVGRPEKRPKRPQDV